MQGFAAMPQAQSPDTAAVDSPVIRYAFDTAALLNRLHFEKYNYDSLFATPVSKSNREATSTLHMEHRDLVLPLMLLIMLGYVTWLRYTFNRELRENLTVILNTNLGQQIYRDREFSANIFKLLTFVNFALALGILILLVTDYFGLIMPFDMHIYNIALGVGLVVVLYIIRGLGYRILGAIFKLSNTLQFFRFNSLVIYHLLGIALLPCILLAAFADPVVSAGAIYAALGLILLAAMIRLVKGLTVAGMGGKLHIVYFLLYICALEVAPMLIAIRLINMWAGLQ